MNNNYSTNILPFEEFRDSLLGELRSRLGEAYTVTSQDVPKNNSVIFHGISIRRDDRCVAPTIYFDEFYNRYAEHILSLDDVVSNIIAIYDDNSDNASAIDHEDFFFEEVRDRIIFRLINHDLNSDLLDKIPHYRVSDLAIGFYIVITLNDGSFGTICISNSIAEKWGVTKRELASYAFINTPRIFPPLFSDMFSVLNDLKDKSKTGGELTVSDADDLRAQMYVLTTRSCIGGAGCLLYPGLLEGIHSRLQSGFYILPCSINEVIIIPEAYGIREHLELMVQEVNSTEISDVELLSDKVYFYPDDSFTIDDLEACVSVRKQAAAVQ